MELILIENKVFDPIARAVLDNFPGSNVTGEYVREPSAFPHVSIVETDNYQSDLDTADEEQYAVVAYEVNVYSNKTTGKKSECMAILNMIDKMLYSMNFRRLSMNPVPNMENASIYRVVARYRAKTDGTTIYRT